MADKMIILAVDDMSMNLRTIRVILEEKYDIRLAKSGELALGILKNTPVKLVLLDIEMPGMSGFDVMAEMRKLPRCGDIPVIFITSHATPELIVSAYDHGAGDYIIKPISPPVLEKKVEALLVKTYGA
ncbi:MAG: response regulator [Treponema sp.]|jgi:putative two-component system response regulator|nr:response regulator [Treponema sp.]